MKTFLPLLGFFILLVAGVQAAPLSELQKIDLLIASVEHTPGAVFIRNGSEYNGAQAAEHLRMKWHKAGSHVRTANDFIVLCASKSSFSGLPYRIRLKNGETMDSEVFFRVQLKRISLTPG